MKKVLYKTIKTTYNCFVILKSPEALKENM